MEKWDEELFGGASGQGQYEKLRALEFEQKKQEALLEAARSREMNKVEIEALFGGFEALKKELGEKQTALQNARDKAEKATLQADIEELVACIAGFDEVTKDDEFTIEK